MVTIISRMKVMRGRLALVRSGYGAAIFPNSIRKLSLRFARLNKDGHMGPRRFWRQFLPRLKYHNPSVEMDVDRSQVTGGPCELVIHFSDNRTATIPCKDKQASDICKAVLELTQAEQLPVSSEDAQLVADYQKLLQEVKTSELRRETKIRLKKEELERQRLGVVA